MSKKAEEAQNAAYRAALDRTGGAAADFAYTIVKQAEHKVMREIIQELLAETYHTDGALMYWQRVKQEIEK